MRKKTRNNIFIHNFYATYSYYTFYVCFVFYCFLKRNNMGNNNKSEMVRINISIPKEFHKTHAKLAVKLDMSFSAYIRFCLRKHLEDASKNLFPLK